MVAKFTVVMPRAHPRNYSHFETAMFTRCNALSFLHEHASIPLMLKFLMVTSMHGNSCAVDVQFAHYRDSPCKKTPVDTSMITASSC
jgi:hypothetical protein